MTSKVENAFSQLLGAFLFAGDNFGAFQRAVLRSGPNFLFHPSLAGHLDAVKHLHCRCIANLWRQDSGEQRKLGKGNQSAAWSTCC